MKNKCFIIVAILIVAFIIYIYNNSVKNCHLIEYSTPPIDTFGPLNNEEIMLLNNAKEDFRIIRGGGGRIGGGGGGRASTRPWRRWPRYNHSRPWRTAFWQYYPEYVYSYPLSYYNVDWVAPIQRFGVRIGPKGNSHPFLGKGSDLGYMITSGPSTESSTGSSTGACGTSGGRIDLKRGETYEFDIYTSKDCITDKDHVQPFFFTTDPVGGADVGRIFDTTPVRNGTLRITITNNIPSQFYYQSTRDKYVGGLVFIN